MKATLRSFLLVLAPLAAAACGSSTSSSSSQGLGDGDKPCTLIAASHEIDLDIDPAFAPKVSSATISVCWDGSCRTPPVALFPSTESVDAGCQGQTCGAQGVSTGGKSAYIVVADLPTESVQVTLELTDAAGAQLSSQSIAVVPTLVYPNGPGCGGEAPQADLVVAADGSLHVR